MTTEDTTAQAIDAQHLAHQREWSERTFGPGRRTLGVIDHIRKELREIEDDPTDLLEWVDVVILAFDGAWRAGWEPQQIIDAVKAKQARNEARSWPDWRTMSADSAIEHDRTGQRVTTTEDNKDQGAAEATTCALITIGVNPDDAEEDTPFFLSALAEAGYTVVKTEDARWEYEVRWPSGWHPRFKTRKRAEQNIKDYRELVRPEVFRRRVFEFAWEPVPEGGEQ